jgi:hypothetical protein
MADARLIAELLKKIALSQGATKQVAPSDLEKVAEELYKFDPFSLDVTETGIRRAEVPPDTAHRIRGTQPHTPTRGPTSSPELPPTSDIIDPTLGATREMFPPQYGVAPTPAARNPLSYEVYSPRDPRKLRRQGPPSERPPEAVESIDQMLSRAIDERMTTKRGPRRVVSKGEGPDILGVGGSANEFESFSSSKFLDQVDNVLDRMKRMGKGSRLSEAEQEEVAKRIVIRNYELKQKGKRSFVGKTISEKKRVQAARRAAIRRGEQKYMPHGNKRVFEESSIPLTRLGQEAPGIEKSLLDDLTISDDDILDAVRAKTTDTESKLRLFGEEGIATTSGVQRQKRVQPGEETMSSPRSAEQMDDLYADDFDRDVGKIQKDLELYGSGDLTLRAPEEVLRDVQRGTITREGAARDHSVVITDKGLDHKATKALRDSRDDRTFARLVATSFVESERVSKRIDEIFKELEEVEEVLKLDRSELYKKDEWLLPDVPQTRTATTAERAAKQPAVQAAKVAKAKLAQAAQRARELHVKPKNVHDDDWTVEKRLREVETLWDSYSRAIGHTQQGGGGGRTAQGRPHRATRSGKPGISSWPGTSVQRSAGVPDYPKVPRAKSFSQPEFTEEPESMLLRQLREILAEDQPPHTRQFVLGEELPKSRR